jgi:hypothetical protein
MITVVSNWSGPEDELDRLKHLPGESGKARMDSALKLAHTEIQGSVHVLTGALKASVKSDSVMAEDIWEGEVSVGQGLGYAKYEQERKGVKAETGTLHDFIAANEHQIDAQYLAAVREVLKK